MTGFHIACVVAAGICLAGAAGALLLPGRVQRQAAEATVAESELIPA